MAGKKKRGGWQRSPYSRKHQEDYDAAAQPSSEEGASKSWIKVARKHRRRRRAHHRKGQHDPESQIQTTCDTEIVEETKHSEDEDKDSLAYHTAEEGDDEDEGGGEENLPEPIVPDYLFEEDDTSDGGDETEDREMRLQSDVQAQILRRLDELREALDCLENGETNEPTEPFEPDGRQENPALPCLADLHRENTVIDSATSVVAGVAGSRAEVEQVPTSDENMAASLVAKTSARKSGIGSFLKRLVRSIPELLFQKDVEEGNIPLLKSTNLVERQEEGSNIQLPTAKNPSKHQVEVSNIRLPVRENLWGHGQKKPNIQLPIPENLRGYQWLEKSAWRFELGITGYSYEGEISGQKMHGYGRLTLKNKGDCIAGNWDGNQLMELKSCQLHYKGKTFSMVKRANDYLLTMFRDRFVATVRLKSTDQLDFSRRTGELKEAFFGKLTTLEILQDELKNKRRESLEELEFLLISLTGEHADPIIRANTFILLKKYSSGNINTSGILNNLIYDRITPPALANAAKVLQTYDSKYCSLNDSFMFLKKTIVHLDLQKIMTKIYKDGLDKHREMLINACPSALPSLVAELRNFNDSVLVYVTKADIDVFDQLANQPFYQQYSNYIETVVKRFGQTIDKIPTYRHPSTEVIPIMSPVFEFLVRSLWEIISEIVEAADCYKYESMLKCESGNWKIEEKIGWTNEQNCNAQGHGVPKSCENKSFYHRSLEVQYKIIFEILECIFPGNSCWNDERINYKFCVLEQDSSQHKGGRKRKGWVNGLQMTIRTGGMPERFKNLSKERLVWLYILDHTVHEVFKDDPKYRDVLKQYDPLLQGQVRFIENSPTESHEYFRVLTHNTVKLITSSASYIRDTAEVQDGVDVEVGKFDVDVEILFQQISNASQNIDHDPLAFSNFRDLIAEYNKYLSLRHFIEIEAAPGYFSVQLTELMRTFMRIVGTSLRKSVPTTALVVYFRSLNDFLDDFRNIDFLAMWYIKTIGTDDQEAMEKVDNKLSDGKNCSYRVTNIEKFVVEYLRLDIPPPRHYIIQIVTALLGCIEKCLHKLWQSDEDQQLVQLKTACIMLDAIRQSFMYLKEQPDYVDFRAFKKESVDPFVRLVDECPTLNDLKKRAKIVKESFWYLRKMDEIDIDQAMILLRDTNTDSVEDKLLSCYNLYISNYNKHIEEYTKVISAGESHAEGLNAVKQMLKRVNPLHFSQWSEKFKAEEIPILLAGLSAIWSILVSKDLSSTGKFLKPHCIQILCILRLLSVGQSTGADNHLAQVLTGQGKSVILGLLSSILALTGHEVRVLCYSKYLSSRDQNDFWELFHKFDITYKIQYSTFEEMANDSLNPTCNGIRKSLRQLVEDRVLNHNDRTKMGSVTAQSENTVLLIDEVDVFFTDNFYGNTLNSCTSVNFRGLAVAQEKIWSLAKTKSYTAEQIVDCTNAFIRAAAGNSLLSDLNAFLSKPGTFSLLTGKGENLIVKSGYTNRTLFDEHLLEMVNDALSVATNPDRQRTQFILNSEDVICARSDNIYKNEWSSSSYCGYLNTFNYFRLKGSNYEHKNYSNYGYLLLHTGNISYAQLPSQFRLILGVSGTLKDLSEYEKSGITSYNINTTTILPSFYGESNLLFDKEANFQYCTQEQDWLKKINNKADKIVQSSRAVLIFFDSDLKMNLFTKKYGTKFDRLNEITPNTEPAQRDAYIEEAGLPGAVTLATRGMGRGVDYKSSLSAEKHGGVHVIQTFYSTDIKEEIQIKGRTARKDNKGSYEIVICKAHLIKENVIQTGDRTAHNYETLDKIRQKLSEEKGKTVTERINRSERDHKTTMEYFGLA